MTHASAFTPEPVEDSALADPLQHSWWPLGRQPVTSLGAARLEDRPSGAVRHAMTEPVALGASAVVRLVGALHGVLSFVTAASPQLATAPTGTVKPAAIARPPHGRQGYVREVPGATCVSATRPVRHVPRHRDPRREKTTRNRLFGLDRATRGACYGTPLTHPTG
jgi:hypothetical protein